MLAGTSRLNVNEMMIVGRVSNVNLDSVFRERVVRMTEIVLTANVVIVGLVYPAARMSIWTRLRLW